MLTWRDCNRGCCCRFLLGLFLFACNYRCFCCSCRKRNLQPCRIFSGMCNNLLHAEASLLDGLAHLLLCFDECYCDRSWLSTKRCVLEVVLASLG